MVVEVHSFLRFLLPIDPFTLEASRQGSISIQTEGALMFSTYVCMCVYCAYTIGCSRRLDYSHTGIA